MVRNPAMPDLEPTNSESILAEDGGLEPIAANVCPCAPADLPADSYVVSVQCQAGLEIVHDYDYVKALQVSKDARSTFHVVSSKYYWCMPLVAFYDLIMT